MIGLQHGPSKTREVVRSHKVKVLASGRDNFYAYSDCRASCSSYRASSQRTFTHPDCDYSLRRWRAAVPRSDGSDVQAFPTLIFREDLTIRMRLSRLVRDPILPSLTGGLYLTWRRAVVLGTRTPKDPTVCYMHKGKT